MTDERWLTTDEINMILVAFLLGRPARITGPEADEMREELKLEVSEIEAEGGIVGIPNL